MKCAQAFALVAILALISLHACAGIGIVPVTAFTPTTMLVTPVNQPGIVNADSVPVRSGPGIEFEQVATLNHGYPITVVAKSADGKWYQVQFSGYAGNQNSLWIAADFVVLNHPTSTVTVAPVVLTSSASAIAALTETIPAVTLIPATVPTETANFVPTFTDTPIPIQIPTFTSSATQNPIPTSPDTTTPVPIQTPTFTPSFTITPSLTPRPIDTITVTDTAETQRAPGTSVGTP